MPHTHNTSSADESSTKASRNWQTPELRRLGTVRDIAQPGAAFDQGNSGKGVAVAS